MVKRDPRRTTGDIEHRVEQRPVGTSVAAVEHVLCLSERRRDASGVEVISADCDRRRDVARCDQLIDGDAKLGAIRLSKPTDAGGKPLKFYLLLRERDPAAQMLVVGKQLERQIVRALDVFRISRERHPTERALPFTKQRSDVLGYEAGDVEGVAKSGIECDGADVVPVIECD